MSDTCFMCPPMSFLDDGPREMSAADAFTRLTAFYVKRCNEEPFRGICHDCALSLGQFLIIANYCPQTNHELASQMIHEATRGEPC